MVPKLAVHVTAELKLPVPCRVAVHCEVALGLIVVGLQATDTAVIVDGAAWTVTVAVPDFVVSSTLVAVTVTVPAVAGAVSSPVAAMLPALADHVTFEL
jgi:hypothetical protein